VSALLGWGDPAIEFFTRRDLLEEESEPVRTVWGLAGPQRLLKKQREDGSWKGPQPRRPAYPANHSDLLATFKHVRLLVERYEFTNEASELQRAADWLLGFQSDEGDIRGFIGNQYATYYTGYVLSLLIRAGYGDDPRIHLSLDWLLGMRQDDGGWTIPMLTHKLDRATSYRLTTSAEAPLQPDREQPFSHNWTDMVLRAFAAHPEYRALTEIQHAAELLAASFFEPDNYSSYRHPRYWTRFAFWWPNLLTAMESLALLGFNAESTGMRTGINWFVEHQSADGMWRIVNDESPESATPTNEERRAWLTLRICRVLQSLTG
jgi:hypothetical protein